MRLLAFAILGAAVIACQKAPEHDTAGPAGECAKCHMPEYQAAKHPVHVGEKPTTCGICHTQTKWRPDRLDHPWPLTGAHAKGHCFYCHHGEEPVFRGTGRDCIDCHRPEYEKAPHHENNPQLCQLCHTTEAWDPQLPNHPDFTPPPEPEVPDAGPAPVDAGAAPVVKPKPKPKPVPTNPLAPPDVTSGGSRRR